MKKILSILLILAMTLTMFACGNKEKDPVTDPETPTYETKDNDPTYIEKDDDNYVTEDEKSSEEEANQVDEDYSYIPYEEEETADTDAERIAMNGYDPEDILALPLPKSYTCSVLNLEKMEMETSKAVSYKSGDTIIPELKDKPFQMVEQRIMTTDGMNTILSYASINGKIVMFQYTINLATKHVKEIIVYADDTKTYTFKY